MKQWIWVRSKNLKHFMVQKESQKELKIFVFSKKEKLSFEKCTLWRQLSKMLFSFIFEVGKCIRSNENKRLVTIPLIFNLKRKSWVFILVWFDRSMKCTNSFVIKTIVFFNFCEYYLEKFTFRKAPIPLLLYYFCMI